MTLRCWCDSNYCYRASKATIKNIKNHAFKEKYIAHKWKNLSKLVIITQSVEYPFVVRKVSGSIPLNYPKGNILVVEFWSPKPKMWVRFLLPLVEPNPFTEV